ncbi:hypothetical protein FG386_000315 [Cryptosporidium ryanae]|uniref:uncharacterized protein n=1 Tax=Cryptosporidium ryanae TaxID=515981 RepID=UPI00351A2C65|nr:hypothetical protein FG386_000315 [Cryptosporidium ryanae]
MNYTKEKLYEQWQLLRLHGIVNSPHLILVYPIYTIQLKSMCLPYTIKGLKGNLEDLDSIPIKQISKSLFNFGNIGALFNSLKCVYYEEGYFGLYRGYIPMMIHSHLNKALPNILLKTEKKYLKKNLELSKSVYIKYCNKYISEIITYPILTIAVQQSVFDSKGYNLDLEDDLPQINDSVVGIYSLLKISAKSERGLYSLWNGITAHICNRIADDVIRALLYNYLSSRFIKNRTLQDKVSTQSVRSSSKRHLKVGISNFSSSLLSPLNLISTIRRCQTNSHNGLCRSDVKIKEILANVNWSIYFGQIVINSLFIAINLLDETPILY